MPVGALKEALVEAPSLDPGSQLPVSALGLLQRAKKDTTFVAVLSLRSTLLPLSAMMRLQLGPLLGSTATLAQVASAELSKFVLEPQPPGKEARLPSTVSVHHPEG